MFRFCPLGIILIALSCGPPPMKVGVDGIQLPENFEIERVRQASEGDGSWVSMAFAPDGSLYVSPQGGTLLRFPVGENGSLLGNSQPISFPVGRAQGLCWAFDSLYAHVAGNADADGGLREYELREIERANRTGAVISVIVYGQTQSPTAANATFQRLTRPRGTFAFKSVSSLGN